MQINPHIPFIAEADLEELANDLLARYEREIEPLLRPPVPIEQIADFLLELNIEWLDMPDTEAEPVLAYLWPASQTIRLNERRLTYFAQYPGLYEYTLAHEIGHYQLHLLADEGQSDQIYLYRHKQISKDRREWQAERFASYLLLPEFLLLPALENVDIQHWPDLYALRDQFQVSITALRIRLEKMGYLHIAANGRPYSSKAAATSDLQQAIPRLAGRAKLYQTLGETAQAQATYQQALTIAQELGDRQNEAFLAWQLGLLYVETDLAQAIALLSQCVAYEQELGYKAAEADAAYVARLKARL